MSSMMTLSSKSLGVYTRATPMARRRVGIVFRDDPAGDDRHLRRDPAARIKAHEFLDERHMCDPDRIDRPTTWAPSRCRAGDDLLRGQADAFIGDVHSAIARPRGDLFGAVGMAVEPRFADDEFEPAPERV